PSSSCSSSSACTSSASCRWRTCAASSPAGACSACGWAPSPTSCSSVASWVGNSPKAPGKRSGSDYIAEVMDPALGGNEELWLRQVWFARLRWIIPPAVVVLGFIVEGLSGKRMFAPLPPILLALSLLGLNVGYRTLLR